MAAQCWLVAYDVADQRRRTRLHKLLRSFGEAVQKSVFVCALDEQRKARLETLLRRQSRRDWKRCCGVSLWSREIAWIGSAFKRRNPWERVRR